MNTSTIFMTMLFTGITCSLGCGTVTTPFVLGSLIGEGYSVQDSRRAILLFSVGKALCLTALGLLASIFGEIVLTQIENIYPNFTIWFVRALTFVLGVRILYKALKSTPSEANSSGCSSCKSSCSIKSSCNKSSSKIKLPKSYFLAGALYATIPCGPLFANLTYASTMTPILAMLLLFSFAIVNSIIPVLVFATIIGTANKEFSIQSSDFLKYIKIAGGIILILASFFKV
ncbi:hypothetical protein AN640_01120 [Candidatus Epulonipiscium fishelsonii]|uniref:Uncharacterized protein n=1 Tax=Candidatus Epulonipiscium fishelsonii TaxID=77094 RepID=A0ACC8XI14_9FIRM|nr:hypothetical protein AN640_01120 [Epulopiscium sp. SCG-D08WGA-EpuloA1]